MERLTDGKIKIVGAMPEVSTQRGYSSPKDTFLSYTSRFSVDIERYFEIVIDQDRVAFTADNLRNKCFINCTFASLPEFRIAHAINVEGVYGRIGSRRIARTFRHRESTRDNSGARRPVAIAMRSDGQRVHRGHFLTETNTLIFGNLFYDMRASSEYLAKFVNELVTQNRVTARPTTQSIPTAQTTPETKTIVEIHNDCKMAVQIKHPRFLVSVGCDPEFEFVNMGQKTPVSPPAGFMGNTSSRIGLDGSGNQLEIRPAPHNDEKVVVENIKNLMREIAQQRWGISTIGDRYPLGGHIHVGIGRTWNQLPRDLVFLLDFFVGSPSAVCNGRARGGYAQLSQYRGQPWGFEYRSCPAGLFDNPELARLSMKAVKNIVECFVNGQTFILTNDTAPQWTDYYNYCHFTPSEFTVWKSLLSAYRALQGQPQREKYAISVTQNWIDRHDGPAPAMPQGEDVRQTIPVTPAPATPAPEPIPEPIPEPQQTRSRRIEDVARELTRRLQEERAQAQQQTAPVHQDAPIIRFRDDWHADVRRSFELALQPIVDRLRHDVVLFGLAMSRGFVTYGYDVDITGHDGALSARIEGSWDGYGVPYVVRVGAETPDVINAHVQALLSALTAYANDPTTLRSELVDPAELDAIEDDEVL